MNRATCLAMALRDKLHEKLHRVTGPLHLGTRLDSIGWSRLSQNLGDNN